MGSYKTANPSHASNAYDRAPVAPEHARMRSASTRHTCMALVSVLAIVLVGLAYSATTHHAAAQVLHHTLNPSPPRHTRAPLLHRVKKSSSKPTKSQAIAVLVNDEPITNYEISQRQGLLGMRATGLKKKSETRFKSMLKAPSTKARLKAMIKEIVDANPGKSRDEIFAIFNRRKKAYALQLQKRAVAGARSSILPGLRKKALEELINERLQLQEAKRLNVLVSDDDVSGVIKNIAQRNKMTQKEFGAYLRRAGSNIETMRTRFKAMMSWRNVIRARFGQQISIKSGDIDRFVAKSSAEVTANSQLTLQRISLALPAAPKQDVIAKRLNDAAEIQRSFTDCASTGALVKKFGGARLENLGEKNASAVKEPTRSLLLTAADGQMLPPIVGPGAIHLWIVCGRKAVNAQTTKRNQAEQSLQQRELDVMAKSHLKDLRQDAHIEHR